MCRILFLVIFSLGLFTQSNAQDSQEFIMRNEANDFYVKFTLSEERLNIYKCQNLNRKCQGVGGSVTIQQVVETEQLINSTLERPSNYATGGALAGLACAALRACPQAGTKIFISIFGGAAIGYGVGSIPQGNMEQLIHEINGQKPLMEKVTQTFAESERTGDYDLYVDYNLEDVVVLYSSLMLLTRTN